MKHLAIIQTEFLKKAIKWEDLSLENQKGYLLRHPKSKRKITTKSENTPELKNETNHLTNIQKKVFSICEPLINDLQEQAVNYYNNKLEQFEDAKNKQTNNISFDEFVRQYSRNNPDLINFLSRVYVNKDTYKFRPSLNDKQLSNESKNRFYTNLKEMIHEYNISKLSRALQKYITDEFVDIKNINISKGSNGFEISANLIDDQDRQWNFNTKAITAGGYNIQVWHYRYIINLSSPEVPRNVVRQKINEQEKLEKQQRKEQRLKEHLEKQKIKFAKNIATLFQDIKSTISDWSSWRKNNLKHYIEQGQRSPEELNKEQEKVDRLQTFLDKYPFKRSEIVEKVLNNRFKLSDFDEIADLFLNDTIGYNNYSHLKNKDPNKK